MTRAGKKCKANAILTQNNTPQLSTSWILNYSSSCSSLGGNLDFVDFPLKSIILYPILHTQNEYFISGVCNVRIDANCV